MKPTSIALALLAATASAHADPLEGKRSSAEILAASASEDWRALDPENTLYIALERGRVVVMLSPVLAQDHVAQIKALAREGFYDGLSFYRVIDGFVAQGGDLFETRDVKTAAKTLSAEFDERAPEGLGFTALPDADGYAPEVGFAASLPTGYDAASGRAWHLHCAGAIAMARDEGRDTAGTEFYITLQPQRYLDRNLSVFGRVVEGMEHIQALRRVAPAETPEGDLGETILSVRVAADLPASARAPLEILRTDAEIFQEYAESRRNRPEAFFYRRPNHVDVCQLPIPVRRREAS
ncbi:peptidylprolyl isomerase [Amphiplicatus metriothermophilus]|uniref:peptidylprolyl isomerase n=1 Tax=Amphiplicatus metriothermophilus TaxID=1519374 RepID=UPI00135B2B6B|nr:peptidylprolyl isomerase [Amphiplicatus metriothermophilus]MBB5518800.1 peptidylprolyl isomerase [Amphiplicatus metriothermophilus]